MDLQTRKIAFVQEFLKLQNEELITTLERLLHQKKAEAYEEDLSPMSTGQFNDEIDQALEDSDKGRLTRADELKAKTKKWQ